MILKSQNGRSMLEMMFVLAIVGILSLVTFWGYEMAMTRYRANEIIKQMEMFAFHIEQQFEAEVDLIEDFDLEDYQPNGEENPDIQIAGYAGSFDVDEETTAFEVTLNAVEEDVCERIMASGWEQPFMIYVNTVPEGDCNDPNNANEMVFAFNNTLDTATPDCNPGYGWNEEQKKCEACPAGKRTVNNQCEDCPENSYQEGNECIPCGTGSMADPGSNKCVCINPGQYWDKEDNLCHQCTKAIAAERCEDVKCNDQSHCGGVGSNMFCDWVSAPVNNIYQGKCKPTGGFRPISLSAYGNSCLSNGTWNEDKNLAALTTYLAHYKVSAKTVNSGSAEAWCAAIGGQALSLSDLGCSSSTNWDDPCPNSELAHALLRGYGTPILLTTLNNHYSRLLIKECYLRWAANGNTAYYQRAACYVP